MNVRIHAKSNRAQLIICRVYIFQIDLMDQIQKKKKVQSKESVSILSSNRRMLENSSRED